VKLCLVVPTRNRPELAIRAARSVLTQPAPGLSVLVSDNSASAEDVRALETLCRDAGDPRLHYVRPAEELSMPAHWDWALEQALSITDATHFGVQYDRKLWKPGELALLRDLCAASPEMLFTYPTDIAEPDGARFICGQMPGTGKVYEIACERVMALTARGLILEMGQIFPVLSNCIVPRAMLERIRASFGDICDSSTPDAAFTYRFCALESRFRYWDRAPTVMHSFHFSNARSLLSGVPGGTWDDFVRLWGDRPFLAAAPIPDLNLGLNVCFHEYNLVRATPDGERFPPVEFRGYLRELSHALERIGNPAHRAAMRARLEAHGWRDERRPRRPSLRRGARRLRHLAGRLLRSAGLRRPLPPSSFASEAEAIAFLIDHPRPRLSHNPEIEIMEPVEVEMAGASGPEPGRKQG
jgi:hypothetical protein